jgi:hypothetical protein
MSDLQVWAMFSANLIVVIAGVGKGLTVLINVRDEIRGLQTAIVGSKETGSGMVGDILELQKEYRRMRDWMIEASAAINVRPPNRS